MCIIGLRKEKERKGEERRGEEGKIRRGPKSFFVIGDVVCNLPNSKLHYLTLHFYIQIHESDHSKNTY
jgi:hypothetical protein